VHSLMQKGIRRGPNKKFIDHSIEIKNYELQS
jgi:hypothetical protein